MATRTKTELALSVLQHLAVVDADGNMAAADSAYVIARYDDMWEELADDNMAYWDRDEIPSVVFEAMTSLMAVIVSGAFGKAKNVRDIDEELRICKRRLRRHTQVRPAENEPGFENF